MNTLDGKIAIVTGAGRGIGRGIALTYGREGARVACVARTLSEVEATAGEVEDGLAISADVSDAEDVSRMIQVVVDHFGGVDILVLNAGGNFDRATIEESRFEDWRRTIDVNLTGAYLCAQAVIPHMKARGGGKIITIGSGMGHRGREGSAAYACAKAGLWMLTRVLAQELWKDGISVNELIPGPVVTSATQDMMDRGGGVFGLESEWIKQPEDLAPLALFLATQPAVGPTAQSFSLMRRDT